MREAGSPQADRGDQPEEPDHAPGDAGPGQEATKAVADNWDSWQGEPGIVRDLPSLRECVRSTDAGTEVEGPGGSWNHRAERGNQPDRAPKAG